MRNRIVSSFAGGAALLGFAVVASSMLACEDVKTPPADPCASMPLSPAENGYPVGNCPFWVAPPNADPPGTCAAAIPGFVDTILPGPDGTLAVSCRYAWTATPTGPTAADIALLPAGALPDCNYVTPQAPADDVTYWARDELRNAAGPRLAPSTSGPVVRAIVLDTVPFEPMWPLPVGAQHGQTLAWMMRDLACEDIQSCPLQVQTALAMPRQIDPTTGTPVIHPEGGSFGLLSDVTAGLWTALRRYREELRMAAQTPALAKDVPVRLVVVSAFGFDNDDQGNVCSDQPSQFTGSVREMYDAYVAAACLGALHVGAAGNSSGGEKVKTGMLCPARWDKVILPTASECATLWGATEWAQIQQDHATVYATKFSGKMAELFGPDKPKAPDHLLSVAGVDYHGTPLVLSRPEACAESVALGLGGIGWESEELVPPVLTGTSVSAAFAAVRMGVAWSSAPDFVAAQLVTAQLSSSNPIEFKRKADCDEGRDISCTAFIPWLAQPPTAVDGQNPLATKPVKNAIESRPDRVEIDPPGPGVCTSRIPHCVLESRAATTDAWPQPGDPMCLKCLIYLSGGATGERAPELVIDGNPSIPLQDFTGAALIVEDQAGNVVLTKGLSPTVFQSRTTIVLTGVSSSIFTNARVWLSAYAADGRTVSQQIFVAE